MELAEVLVLQGHVHVVHIDGQLTLPELVSLSEVIVYPVLRSSKMIRYHIIIQVVDV